jgi:hypothetical protein
MAIVKTDNKHYSAIAGALRTALETVGTYRPEDMAPAVPMVYEAGVVDGKAEAEARCSMKHFVTVLPGSGQTSITVHVPFEPQFVMIAGYGPTAILVNNTAMALICDLVAFGMMGGSINRWNGSTVAQTSLTTVSIYDRYSRDEDGFVTLTAKINNTSSAVFAENVQYTLIAVKYTDKTDRERITEMVNGLTGSGSVTMNKAKVSAAFTDEEWEALIATKPDWTFAFVG